ncbi:MAG: glycyl-radical enzyme activating protein, partial [Oscillospiraceae bacterium]|nr:glycyl-radical enzyme activating protein [Oscillospiraceae bacterium]
MLTGQIFDIQRFSIHDGPGIRTTVFFAGCNLRCFWCHNPEAFVSSPKEKSAEAEAVMAEVLKDKPFYRKDGGVTFSGGEPMLQFEFLRSLISLAKSNGLHTAVDTAGNVPFERFLALLDQVDLWLYDIKCADESLHKKHTGTQNKTIFENLENLCGLGAKVIIRIPVIPTFNASSAAMGDICGRIGGFAANNDRISVELLPFHRLGQGKYEALGLTYKAAELAPPKKEE